MVKPTVAHRQPWLAISCLSSAAMTPSKETSRLWIACIQACAQCLAWPMQHARKQGLLRGPTCMLGSNTTHGLAISMALDAGRHLEGDPVPGSQLGLAFAIALHSQGSSPATCAG